MAEHRKTIVKHKGTVNFWSMTPEQRVAYMRGGGSKAARARTRELRSFTRERDAVLRALDVTGMVALYQRYAKPLPPEWADPTVPYAMMHKARLHVENFTVEEKAQSKAWLTLHGYSHDLFMKERTSMPKDQPTYVTDPKTMPSPAPAPQPPGPSPTPAPPAPAQPTSPPAPAGKPAKEPGHGQ